MQNCAARIHRAGERVSRRKGGVFLAPKDWAVDVDMKTQVVLGNVAPSVRQVSCAGKPVGRASDVVALTAHTRGSKNGDGAWTSEDDQVAGVEHEFDLLASLVKRADVKRRSILSGEEHH